MFRTLNVLQGPLIFASLLMASCGSSEPASNAPPKIAKAPGALSIAEGESAETTLAVDPSVTSVSVTSAHGLEVEAVAGPNESSASTWLIRVRAPYGVSGALPVELAVQNANGSVAAKVDVTVAAASWAARQTWTDGPEAREHGAVIRDDANKRVILIGGSGYKPYGTPLGDVWAWSLTDKKWSKPAVEGDVPAAAGSRRVALDGSTAYLFGGYGEGSAANDELIRVELGNPIKFKKLTHPGPIPARSLHAFVKAPDGFIVFGGASTKPLNDTWKLTIAGDTVAMTKLETPVAPTARYGFFYGADEKRLIVWSGAQSFSTVKPAQDTWAFDFAANEWSQLAVDDPNAPKGRRNGCFVYDQLHHRLFVFGGTADAMNTEAGFYVLDARVGKEAWTKVEREGEPPLRSSGFGFFDPVARTASCGFGNTTTAVYADWSSFGPP